MKKILITFFLTFLFISIFYLSANAYEKRITLTEKSGELVDSFSYVIDDNARTITINGKGKLTNNYNYNYEWENFDYKLNYTLVFGNGITEIDCSSDILPRFATGGTYLGKDIKNIDELIYDSDYWGPYKVDSANQYFSVHNNSLYTKDFRKLLSYHCNKEPNDFHPNLNEIGDYAFTAYKFNGGDTIIIPWGVTKVGDYAFLAADNGYYVMPDTVKQAGWVTDESEHHFGPDLGNFPYWIPSRNNSALWNAWHTTLNGDLDLHLKIGNTTQGLKWLEEYGNSKITDIPADNIAKYYDIRPNSLKTFQNGKTYYFDNNYKMATGWKRMYGNWYYFNDYGAAVVKIWLQLGNKWYYMQEDGTMATNKWIKWYNKWYYVGKDGAMYTNRKTPDGYYVNASGVWVK